MRKNREATTVGAKGKTPVGEARRDAPARLPEGFSVCRVGPGHWDVTARLGTGGAPTRDATAPAEGDAVGRVFAIRGEPGDVHLRDERRDAARPQPREPLTFRSVAEAMVWVCAETMAEPSETDGVRG